MCITKLKEESIGMIDKIIKILLSIDVSIYVVLITGFTTFLITRYSENRKAPLDKMEISYNRVYYPLYKIVRGKECKDINHEELCKLSERIFLKYDKYISQATRITYQRYVESQNKNEQIKTTYVNYANNILKYNAYFRRKLGYPQAGVFEMYKYFSKTEKLIVRFTFNISITLILLITYVFVRYEWIAIAYAVSFVFSIFLFISLTYSWLRTLDFKSLFSKKSRNK